MLSWFGLSSVGVACPQWMWYVLSGGGMSTVGASIGVSMASIGVAWPQWMWHCVSMCDIASVGMS